MKVLIIERRSSVANQIHKIVCKVIHRGISSQDEGSRRVQWLGIRRSLAFVTITIHSYRFTVLSEVCEAKFTGKSKLLT